MIKGSYDFLFKNNKTYLTLNNEINRLNECSDKLDTRVAIFATIAVISGIISFCSFVGFIAGLGMSGNGIFGVVSLVMVPIFLSSLFVCLFSRAKNSSLWNEKLRTLRDQRHEMFVEKVSKDLKEQYGAVFFNSEVHPSHSKYEIKFDNGKHYMARVFYTDGKMIVELLNEKHYMKPTGVSTDEKPKTDFDVIDGLKNV